MPWALAKEEDKLPRLKTVLYTLTEGIRYLGVLLSSFMPETSEKIFAQINAEDTSLESLDEFGKTVSGSKVGEATPLFARIDEEKKLAEITAEVEAAKKEAEKNAKKEEKEEDKAEEITIDDFCKVQMKVGEVIECKPVEGAKKLLVSQIKIGNEVRQIVSGIAMAYSPEEMVGKKVVVITNLKPCKLRGVLSEGMILAAGEGDKISLVTPDDLGIESGAEVR